MTTASASMPPAVADVTAPTRARGRTLRVFLLTLLGSLLLQAAWILAVPPFVGMDEIQHATKAAAVAHGDWSPRHASQGSFGGVVEVPGSLVAAARSQCLGRGTTDRYNCEPISHQAHGMVTVTSLAAAYNPMFYAVVGAAGLPFQGTSSLYAMRVCAALMCGLMIALAAAVSVRCATSRAPLMSLLAAAVPVLWYSASILAPNGLEMCAALVVWASLLGMVRRRGAHDVFVVFAGTLSACLVAVLRGSGPIWLLLILGAVAMVTPRATMKTIVTSAPARLGALMVLVAMLGAVAWIMASWNSNHPPPAPHAGSAAHAVTTGLPLWAMGTFAMYPGPQETAPMLVYALGLVVWPYFLWEGARRARRSIRLSSGFVIAVAVVVPVGLTLVSYERLGLFWQGRYALPLLIGMPLMLGLAWDEVRDSPPRGLVVAVCFGTFVENALSLRAIVSDYLPYRSALPGWQVPNLLTITILVAAGAAALFVAVLTGATSRQLDQSAPLKKA